MTPPTDPPREASDEQIAELLKLAHLRIHAGTSIGRAGACEEYEKLAFRIADELAREVQRLRAAAVPPLPTAADVEQSPAVKKAMAKFHERLAEVKAADVETRAELYCNETIMYGMDVRELHVKQAFLAGARSEAERMAAEVAALRMRTADLEDSLRSLLSRDIQINRNLGMSLEAAKTGAVLRAEALLNGTIPPADRYRATISTLTADRDRLAAELRQCRDALKPFADKVRTCEEAYRIAREHGWEWQENDATDVNVSLGNCRKAAATLAATGQEGK